METPRKVFQEAETKRVAIGRFNISDLVTLKAVFEAARGLNVLLGDADWTALWRNSQVKLFPIKSYR